MRASRYPLNVIPARAAYKRPVRCTDRLRVICMVRVGSSLLRAVSRLGPRTAAAQRGHPELSTSSDRMRCATKAETVIRRSVAYARAATATDRAIDRRGFTVGSSLLRAAGRPG